MVIARKVLLSGVSGILLFTSFAPIDFWPGAFLGTALLYGLIKDEVLLRRSVLSFISGALFFLPLLHWSSTYVGALPWLILALGEAVIFSLVGLLPFKGNFGSAIQFAATFTLVEIVRMKAPFGGFGWGRLGFTQVDSLAHLYPYISIAGISFLITFISVLFVTSFKHFLFATFLIVLLISIPIRIQTDGEFSVIAVQGGVDRLGLDFNDRALSVLSRHAEETMKISNPSQLVIWPENASDLDPIRNTEANAIIKTVIQKIDRPLLIGAVESSSHGPQNSSILFGSDGEIKSRYVKQDLAPFGEYIPLRPLSEAISREAIGVRDFIPGRSWVRHTVDETTFSSAICFEILDDDHIRSGAQGSEFIVAQTNNATFGKSWQAAQQLQITRSRAAELGKSFVVVSTTGFTAQISPDGSIVKELKQFEPGYLNMDIEKVKGESAASKVGSQAWIFFAAGLIALSRTRIFSR